MKIKTNKINSANAQIEAQIPKEMIDANVEKIAKKLTKTASVQGFRKGKVPVAVVKKQYGERLVQDAEAEALREVLNKGLDELKIAMNALIGEPNISNFVKNADNIEVTVKIAMRPEINLDNYKDMVDEFEKPVVTDEQVTERLEKIADSQGKFVDLKKKEQQKMATVLLLILKARLMENYLRVEQHKSLLWFLVQVNLFQVLKSR